MKTQKVEKRGFLERQLSLARPRYVHTLAAHYLQECWEERCGQISTSCHQPSRKSHRRGEGGEGWRSRSGGWGGQKNIEALASEKVKTAKLFFFKGQNVLNQLDPLGLCFLSPAGCVLSVWSVGDLIFSPRSLMSRQAWRRCDKAKNAAGALDRRAAAATAATIPVQWLKSQKCDWLIGSPVLSLFISAFFLPLFADWLSCLPDAPLSIVSGTVSTARQ